LLQALKVEGPYERVDITGLVGITEAQRQNMMRLGAVDKDAV
jgi:hypothetical protein